MSLRFPLDGAPELSIQVECSGGDKVELWERTAAAWEKMGHEDPYFNVVTSPDYHLAEFERNQKAFWTVGVLEAERMFAWMDRSSVRPPRPGGTCLEYGCGVGRVTRGLERHFDKVIACDVSAPYLRLAQAVVSPRTELHLITTPGTLSALPEFDVLFSLIVLQHNPPPVIAFILEALLTKLNYGGLAFFQVPTLMKDYTFSVRQYLRDPEKGSLMEMHCLPQRYIFEIASRCGCRPLEVSQDDRTDSDTHVSTTFLLIKDQQ